MKTNNSPFNCLILLENKSTLYKLVFFKSIGHMSFNLQLSNIWLIAYFYTTHELRMTFTFLMVKRIKE